MAAQFPHERKSHLNNSGNTSVCSTRTDHVRIETQDDSPRASLMSVEDYNSVTGILKRRELTSKERKESGPLKPRLA
jgi:hypothetical protein